MVCRRKRVNIKNRVNNKKNEADVQVSGLWIDAQAFRLAPSIWLVERVSIVDMTLTQLNGQVAKHLACKHLVCKKKDRCLNCLILWDWGRQPVEKHLSLVI